MLAMGNGPGWGIAFLVAAGIVFEIIAAACSSPQTTEINADKRADTLMKWVWIGVAMSAGLVLIAASVDKSHRQAILLGGTLAGTAMVILYLHAKNAGLKKMGPGTES